MARQSALLLVGAAFGIGLALPSGAALSQGRDIGGTWTVVSDNTRPDGTKVQTFGSNPQGMLTFEVEGPYTLQICSADRPKFASNNRLQGTPDENKSAG